MRTARGLRAACLALGLALLGPACTGSERDSARDGVRGGTLRVLSTEDIAGLDTAVTYTPNEVAIARAYARGLYGYDLSGSPEQATVPVPDIANGPPQVSPDRRTYTFALRPGVRYAPPVDREVAAQDFITAIERFYDEPTPASLAPLPGRQYADLIAGAAAFGAGKAEHIAGLAAPDPRTLNITLVQPASDLLWILTQAMFAPVPEEHAASYTVGENYSGHVVGAGPYKLATYMPGETVVLDRNPNWDPATDPLRKVWVDRIQVKLDVGAAGVIQRAIEQEQADLALHSHVPQTKIAALRADPERSGRLEVARTGCQWFLFLGTDRRAGAIADVRVRRAVNYAVDKIAYRDAIAGGYAPTGELASTILAPGSLGYQPYDLYPTPGGRGDPAKAKALLAEAGYPKGLTLGFATFGSGRQAAATKPIQDALAKAGIDLKVKRYDPASLWFESLAVPAKRLEHQLGLTAWCPDYLGDNARPTIVTRFDGHPPTPTGANISEYDNPAVDRMIDQALAELDQARRAAIWGEIDRRIMRDAPVVPLIWENQAFLRSSRVRGWTYDPWTATPSLTTPWLDPASS
jgi:ABC-type transport system substrate-binding protein